MIHCAAMVFGSYCVWVIEATKSRLNPIRYSARNNRGEW
jgi:hypothetical protein